MQLHLAHDAKPVVFHRLLTDVEDICNLARRTSLCNELEDLALACSKTFVRFIGTPAAASAREILIAARGHLRRTRTEVSVAFRERRRRFGDAILQQL